MVLAHVGTNMAEELVFRVPLHLMNESQLRQWGEANPGLVNQRCRGATPLDIACNNFWICLVEIYFVKVNLGFHAPFSKRSSSTTSLFQGNVMTRFPAPVPATATKTPLPYATRRHELLPALSLILPYPKAPGVSSSRIRDARRLALYILHNTDSRRPPDSVEVAELCPKREHGLAGPSFRFLSTIIFPEAPGAHNTLEQTCVPHAFQLNRSYRAWAIRW